MVPGPSGESFTALSRCRYRLQASRRIETMKSVNIRITGAAHGVHPFLAYPLSVLEVRA
jgi:hypothetical protein